MKKVDQFKNSGAEKISLNSKLKFYRFWTKNNILEMAIIALRVYWLLLAKQMSRMKSMNKSLET